MYWLFFLSVSFFFSPAQWTRTTPCFFVSVAPRTAMLWCWQQVTRQGHEGQRIWQDKGKVRLMKNGYRAKGKLWSITKVWDGSKEFFQQHHTSSETRSQVEDSVFLLCSASERPTAAVAWTAALPRVTIYWWLNSGHFREQKEELLPRQRLHPSLSQANQDLPIQPWGLFPFHLESDNLLSPSLPGKPSPQILRSHQLSKSSLSLTPVTYVTCPSPCFSSSEGDVWSFSLPLDSPLLSSQVKRVRHSPSGTKLKEVIQISVIKTNNISMQCFLKIKIHAKKSLMRNISAFQIKTGSVAALLPKHTGAWSKRKQSYPSCL